jgi:hypothetical protein
MTQDGEKKGSDTGTSKTRLSLEELRKLKGQTNFARVHTEQAQEKVERPKK